MNSRYFQNNQCETGKSENMLQLKKLLLILFFVAAGVNGVYKYLDKGVLSAHSQWDLRSHIIAFNWEMNDRPETEAGHPQVYLPPYTPVAFPILDAFGELDWPVAKLLWLITVSLGLMWCFVQSIAAANQDKREFEKKMLLLLASFTWLFPATFIALAAGQMSLLVSILLTAFFTQQNQRPALAIFCLAVSTAKLTLAAPFFLVLFYQGKYRMLIAAAGLAILLNFIISFFYLGPIGHLEHMWNAAAGLEALGVNSYLKMGASGRIDLAPLAATFDIYGWLLMALLTVIAIGGFWTIYRTKEHSDGQILLLNLNLLFFALMYHRQYDLVIILILALPIVWKNREYLKIWHLAGLLPLVLPLQSIYSHGVQYFPEIAILWNIVGSATIISLVTLAAIINFRPQ